MTNNHSQLLSIFFYDVDKTDRFQTVVRKRLGCAQKWRDTAPAPYRQDKKTRQIKSFSDSCQKNVGEIQGNHRADSSRRVKKSRQIVFGQLSEKCLI